MAFVLTDIQKKARTLLNGVAKFILLFGGSRSGKTAIIIRNIILRALKEPNSRHAIFRQTRKDLKEAVWMDTLPKILRLCFPGVEPYSNEQELYIRFDNGSEIWFGYLDDKKRTDNVLGKEYNTLYFNEISEIAYALFNKALTRLALKNGLVNKIYCDCNPPGRWHWAYKVFIEKIIPGTKDPLPYPDKYASLLMNPKDNAENLAEDYLEILEGLPEEEQNRFLHGIWAEGIFGGIYTKEIGLAELQGRITTVAHNPEFSVYTIWDLGIGDSTSIWFCQFIGSKLNFIDYYENQNEGMKHYTCVLKKKQEELGYQYGTLFLPHDGANKEWLEGRTRQECIEEEGFEVEVLPRTPVEDGINSAKILFSRCYFDKEKCAAGLDCLRNYRRAFDPLKLVFSPEPVHDWSSHGSDSFRYTGMAYNSRLVRPSKKEQAVIEQQKKRKALSFNEILKQRRRRRHEIH